MRTWAHSVSPVTPEDVTDGVDGAVITQPKALAQRRLRLTACRCPLSHALLAGRANTAVTPAIIARSASPIPNIAASTDRSVTIRQAAATSKRHSQRTILTDNGATE